MIGLVLLAFAVAIGVAVWWLGREAGWHWGVSVGAGLVPVGFTFFLGIFGVLISIAFLGAIWRAAAV